MGEFVKPIFPGAHSVYRETLQFEIPAKTVGERLVILDDEQPDRIGISLRFVHSYNCNPQPPNQMQDSRSKMQDPPSTVRSPFVTLHLVSCILYLKPELRCSAGGPGNYGEVEFSPTNVPPLRRQRILIRVA